MQQRRNHCRLVQAPPEQADSGHRPRNESSRVGELMGLEPPLKDPNFQEVVSMWLSSKTQRDLKQHIISSNEKSKPDTGALGQLACLKVLKMAAQLIKECV